MTREELKEHCEKQIEMCEMWAISKGKKPSGNIYEEHKLILELLEQEPCDGAVNRQAVLNTLDNMDKALNEDRTVENYKELLKECYEVLPSVTAQQKTGHWIKDYDNSALDGLYHCSVCGRKLWIPKEDSVSDYPYCHCGADMRGDE